MIGLFHLKICYRWMNLVKEGASMTLKGLFRVCIFIYQVLTEIYTYCLSCNHRFRLGKMHQRLTDHRVQIIIDKSMKKCFDTKSN